MNKPQVSIMPSSTLSSFLLLLAGVLLIGTTTAFQPLVKTCSKRPSSLPLSASPQSNDNNGLGRRDLFQTAFKVFSTVGVLSGLTATSPLPASAASPVINELKIRESIKGVKDSVEALKLYEDFVTQKDFYGIKKSLRVPPVSEIRRDCRRIIAGLDGSVKKDTDKAYNNFIENLEQVDLISTRAIQNDNTIKDEDLKVLTDKFAKSQMYLEDVYNFIKTTRYVTEPVSVRVETASAE